MSAELMVRAQAGDTGAFADLYVRYRPLILSIAARECPGHAADIFHDVFIRILRNPAWTNQGSDPGAWVTVVTRNVCRDHQKAWYQRMVRPGFEAMPEVCDDDRLIDPVWRDEHLALRAELAAGMARLTADQARAIDLHHLRELPLKDVAAVMGREVNAVKTLLVRARRALGKVMADA